MGTLGWVEGTTKTPKDRGRDDKDTDKEDKESWEDTKRKKIGKGEESIKEVHRRRQKINKKMVGTKT